MLRLGASDGVPETDKMEVKTWKANAVFGGANCTLIKLFGQKEISRHCSGFSVGTVFTANATQCSANKNNQNKSIEERVAHSFHSGRPP